MDSLRSDRFLALSSFLDRTPEQDAWLVANIERISSWEELLDTAHDNRVVPMLRWQLDQLGLLPKIPAPARDRLEAGAAEVAAKNEARLLAGSHVLAALTARGIPVVVLKGVMLGEALYRNPSYKRMNDIDILIRKEDLRAVYQVYEELGLFYLAERVGGDIERQASVSHHAPPFINRELTCMMGTQWAFKSPLLRLHFDYEAIWARTVPLTLRGVQTRRLSWGDQLHHLCVHLDRFKSGTRDLMDVFNLVHAHGASLDWDLLREEILAAGTEDYVYYTLSLAQSYRPHFAAADLLDAIAPRVSPAVRRRTAFRSRSTRVLLRNSSRQLSTIEKAVSTFNATHSLAEKLPLFVRGYKSIFFPPIDEAMRICALTEPTLGNRLHARIHAPRELLRAIRDEIGGLLLLGLSLKSVLDLARSVFQSRGGDLQSYADRTGVSLQQLRAVQDAFE